VPEVQTLDGPTKERGAAGIRLQEHHLDLEPLRGDNEAREAAARTKINEAARSALGQSARNDGEPLGMPDLLMERTRSEESQSTSFSQKPVERSGGVPPVVGAGHRRRISPRER
jgi:hypothetical protein